jgi:hypothetical protein
MVTEAEALDREARDIVSAARPATCRSGPSEVDVFLGEPPLCHPVDFSQRLHSQGAVRQGGVLDARARERIAGLAEAIAAAPKTRRWGVRAKVGTRVRWYEEVEELGR